MVFCFLSGSLTKTENIRADVEEGCHTLKMKLIQCTVLYILH